MNTTPTMPSIEYGIQIAGKLLTGGRVERHMTGERIAALCAMAFDAGAASMQAKADEWQHLNGQNCESIRRLEADRRELIEALRRARESIDISVIRPGVKSERHWATVIAHIDAALAKVDL